MPVFYPNQKLPVTEIESPDEITSDSPDGLYIQEGGSGGNSGGTTIHYYDSLEAAEAANLPDGAFVAVPEKVFDLTAMGFPVVEQIGQYYTLQTDTTEICKAFASGHIDFSFDFMASGNKVIVHADTVSMPAAGGSSAATMVLQDTTFVAANIMADEATIMIFTKALA